MLRIIALMKKAVLINYPLMLDNFKMTVELSMILGFIGTIYDFIANFILDDKEFMFLVSIAIIIDHVVGSYMWFIKRKFSIKKNMTGLFLKVALCICGFFLFEGLTYILGEESFLATYFQVVTHLTLFLYPAGSAFMNMSVLTKGIFPPIGWINRIKAFNEDLDLDKFNDHDKHKAK